MRRREEEEKEDSQKKKSHFLFQRKTQTNVSLAEALSDLYLNKSALLTGSFHLHSHTHTLTESPSNMPAISLKPAQHVS